ncbi:MAG: DeoR/GlpR transcriptional regulator [bacterium]|nr:DeoR/GlpR transcriptional regulator [bacterium]
MAIIPLKRMKLLVGYIEQKGIVGIKELAEYVNVSESTVRRDLIELSKQNLIKIERGGAASIQERNGADLEGIVPQHYDKLQAAKQQIGKTASSLINDGETIILDPSSTVLELVKALASDVHITCITNALLVAAELCKKPNIDTILVGGSLSPKLQASMGPVAEQNLRQFHAQKVFLGTAGISEMKGITNQKVDLIPLRRIMMDIAEEIIVLADTSKFSKLGLAPVAELNEIDCVITNSGIDEKYLAMLKKYKIDVILSP